MIRLETNQGAEVGAGPESLVALAARKPIWGKSGLVTRAADGHWQRACTVSDHRDVLLDTHGRTF